MIDKISSFLWGYPLLVVLMGGGLFLSAKLRFPQLHIIEIFRRSVQAVFKDNGRHSGISQFQGFSTALAAAVGTGSVVGVGAAIAIGGRGAVFWMWISAFIGMGISYSENYLGVKYSLNSGLCGAQAYLEKIGRGKIIAVIYALFSVLASLGMGNMAQANSAVSALEQLHIPKPCAAFIIVIFTAVTACGCKTTAKICEKLVPFMALFFCAGSLYIILSDIHCAANAFRSIVSDAFSPSAFAGGFAGSALMEGIKRGAFSNEAGLGSSVAVHSSCEVKSPQVQGIMGMAEVFIDTVIICTLTAIVILVSGTDISVSDCAVNAYCESMGSFGKIFISLSLTLFALATIAGWFFIGEKSWSYLFPDKKNIYKILCVFCAYAGAVYSPSIIWGISDIFNGLAAIPNMTGVLVLSKEIKKPSFSPSARRNQGSTE